MSQFKETRWRCDYCQRDVKRGVMPPSGWHESTDRYGNAWHCCGDMECVVWMKRFNEENGYETPKTMQGVV